MRAGLFILFFVAGVCVPPVFHGETNAFEVLVGEETSEEPELSAAKIISFYQKRISPVDGAKCMFYPTCSQYFKEALSRYGFIRAAVMTVDRILYREGKSSMKYYSYDPEIDRFSDPVEKNSILEQRDCKKK